MVASLMTSGTWWTASGVFGASAATLGYAAYGPAGKLVFGAATLLAALASLACGVAAAGRVRRGVR